MGTRSLTHVADEHGTVLCTMYRQFDGYPEGHGDELAQFLREFTVVNGINEEKGKIANSMGCLAAQLVANFKDGPGGICLEAPGVEGCWEEYIYTVYQGNDSIRGTDNQVAYIKCVNVYTKRVLFDGPAASFIGADAKHIARSTDAKCIWCDREFKHPAHARNHYAARHDEAVP